MQHSFEPSATFDGTRGRYCIICGRKEMEHEVWNKWTHPNPGFGYEIRVGEDTIASGLTEVNVDTILEARTTVMRLQEALEDSTEMLRDMTASAWNENGMVDVQVRNNARALAGPGLPLEPAYCACDAQTSGDCFYGDPCLCDCHVTEIPA